MANSLSMAQGLGALPVEVEALLVWLQNRSHQGWQQSLRTLLYPSLRMVSSL